MKPSIFSHSSEQFQQIAQDCLQYAKQKGASDAAIQISEGSGLSVSVRKGEIETIEQNRDKGMDVTVYLGKHRGNASTSDFSVQSLKDTVDAAYNIAKFTAADAFSGLPEVDYLEKNPIDLALFYPWHIDAQDAVKMAKEMEEAGFAVSKQITNSDGAGVYVSHSHFISANSLGFMAGYPYSRHTLSTALIAGKGKHMQRDGWYTTHRNFKKLASATLVGDYAARRALSRLGARAIPTQKCPVLFESPLAAGLLGAFVQATSGGALYRRSSFLVDSLGQAVFPSDIQIFEDPFIKGGLGSSPFDEEGVRTQQRELVKDGVVQGYFLSTYTGKKLNMPTTGNAGGSHNLHLYSSKTKKSDHLEAMIRQLHTGFLVTDLMGDGVNYVTGDYSRGASGFWVENGVIQFPVEEVTIAGNLKDMFKNIVAIGSDTLIRGTKSTGSILISEMTIAGNDQST